MFSLISSIYISVGHFTPRKVHCIGAQLHVATGRNTTTFADIIINDSLLSTYANEENNGCEILLVLTNTVIGRVL